MRDAVRADADPHALMRRFQGEPGLAGLIVNGADGPVGVACRRLVLEASAFEGGRTDTAGDLAAAGTRTVPVLPETTSIEHALDAALARGPVAATDPIVATDADGRWRLIGMDEVVDAYRRAPPTAGAAEPATDEASFWREVIPALAHEAATPMGNAVMLVGSIDERAAEQAGVLDEARMTRAGLRAFLDTIRTGARMTLDNLERAANLIDGLKRMSVDQGSSARRRFELDGHLEDLARSFEPRLRKAGITLIERAPAGVMLDSYPGALSQILSNLVMNALRHGFRDDGRAPGDRRIEIDAGLPEPETVRVTVSDNGAGIPAGMMARIFDRYVTTRAGEGGSGLGLSVSRELAREALGGGLTVESGPGRGTRFVLTMPRVAPQRASDEAERADAPNGNAAPGGSRQRLRA